MINSIDKEKTIVKKAGLLLIIKLLSAAFALFFHYLLAKQLSATQFGLFSLSMSCLLFAVVFAKQGLEQVTVRFLAKDNKGHFARLYWLILSYAFVSAIIVSLVIFVLLSIFSEDVFAQPLLKNVASLIALLTIIQATLAINSSTLKGKERAISALLFSGFLGFAIAICLLILNPVNSSYQAIIYFTYAMSISLLFSFLVIGKTFGKSLMISKEEYCNAFNDSFEEINKVSRRLLIISLSALITQQLSVLILAKYSSLALIGNFSLALKMSLLLSYPLLVINIITAPKYARLYYDRQLEAFKTLALKITKYLFIIASLGVMLFYLSIDNILSSFDPSYNQVASLVKILIIGQWFNLATGSVVSMLIMSGFEKIHRRNTIILTLMNIIALVIFIPSYGVWAAAIITAVTMAIKNIVALIFVNKLIYVQAK